MIRVGLYGINGHQLPVAQPSDTRAVVTAVAAFPAARLDDALGADTPTRRGVREYPTLADMLADSEIDLISLCSPRRADQAQDACLCLRAGKHVLAEKPSAFTDDELDMILQTSRETGREFREMNDSMLQPAVRAIRELVDAGALGEIVHAQAHKSYPWHDRRPQDMDTDGGLARQVGIHAVRYIIGGTGLKITSTEAVTTGIGNPGAGEIQMACAAALTLDNGAVASVNLNYLNPPSFGSWGNDQLRVYGTKGMAESVDGFRRSTLYLVDSAEGTDLPMPTLPVSTYYLTHYANFLLDGTPMPVNRDEELAAQRAVIALHHAAVHGKTVTVKQ